MYPVVCPFSVQVSATHMIAVFTRMTPYLHILFIFFFSCFGLIAFSFHRKIHNSINFNTIYFSYLLMFLFYINKSTYHKNTTFASVKIMWVGHHLQFGFYLQSVLSLASGKKYGVKENNHTSYCTSVPEDKRQCCRYNLNLNYTQWTSRD